MKHDPPPGPLAPGQSRAVLVDEVQRQLGHLDIGSAVVVACSGGPDSTALAFLVAEARPDLTVTLAHVRHGLRPDDATDAALVEQHAGWIGCLATIVDAAADVEVARDGHGTEAAARTARYAALRRVAAACSAVAILVAHTADDQAETVLLRAARGTGVAGLAAMAPIAADLVRPLLRVRRSDVHRFVTLEGLPTAIDESNADDAVRRVRVRREVLPALGRVAPDPVGALGRLADLARDDEAALAALATDAIAAGALRQLGDVMVLDRRVLEELSASVARRVVRAAARPLLGAPPPLDTVVAVLGAEAGTRRSLPGGLDLEVGRRWVTLTSTTAAAVPLRVGAIALVVPGPTAWPLLGAVVQAIGPDPAVAGAAPTTVEPQLAFDLASVAEPDDVLPPWRPPPHRPDPAAVPPGGHPERLRLLLPDGLASACEVRTLRPGDRIATDTGHRRIVEVLREAGVPLVLRGRIPVLATADSVVWVPGYVADPTVLRAGASSPAFALELRAATG